MNKAYAEAIAAIDAYLAARKDEDSPRQISVRSMKTRSLMRLKRFDEAMANLTGMYSTAVLSSYSFSRFDRRPLVM